jgi:hypothetical protein
MTGRASLKSTIMTIIVEPIILGEIVLAVLMCLLHLWGLLNCLNRYACGIAIGKKCFVR